MMNAPIRTTCAYCGVGCGILARQDGEGRLLVEGDPDHPANRGRLCGKGQTLGDTLLPEGRLLHPQIGGERASWDAALSHVAEKLNAIRAEHGPDAIAFYLSGQLLTEDYYAANKLMKGFVGTANVDTNSRLCMSSAVAAHKRAFGEDVVPGLYEDFELADLVVLTGSNAAWCHPVLFQRFEAAREVRGSKLVVIDPRKTATAQAADLHLPIAPGSDVALFNGLFRYLCEKGAVDEAFIARATAGFEKMLPLLDAAETEIASVAQVCRVAPELIERFYAWVTETERWVTGFSQGVNQSSQGTDKGNALINCHLATGRIGKPGMGPFSITGQPNAMGGREVGGLANMLAAHMGFAPADVARTGRFWNAPQMAEKEGLKAVDLFDAVHEGRVKAVWIMATNPAVSLPDADRVRAALEKCDLVIVSDCVAETDTLSYAHVALPAQGWGEKDGTVTNSERRISRQRRIAEAPGEAKPDWWILTQVARRMGFAEAFPYEKPAEIFREHAALSGFENYGARVFDISAYAEVTDEAYEEMAPFLWPAPAQGVRRERPFQGARFAHEDGRAHFVAAEAAAPRHAPDALFPLVLNTGRLRDQWHTMTRTGLVPRLFAHVSEPTLFCHPADAAAQGIKRKALVEVETAWGKGIFRAVFDEGLARGHIFLPIHWTDRMTAKGITGALVNPVCDPISGQPEFKHTPARMRLLEPAHAGFLITNQSFDPSPFDYWAKVPLKDGTLYYLASLADDAPFEKLDRLSVTWYARGEVMELRDKGKGALRRVLVKDGVTVSACFMGPAGSVPDPAWLAQQMGTRAEGAAAASLLAALPMDPAEAGPKVCSCFGVSAAAITEAVQSKGLTSVKEIGNVLQAGTNCGACRPELAALLEQARLKEAV